MRHYVQQKCMTIQVYFSDSKLEFFQTLYQVKHVQSHLLLNNNAAKLLVYFFYE